MSLTDQELLKLKGGLTGCLPLPPLTLSDVIPHLPNPCKLTEVEKIRRFARHRGLGTPEAQGYFQQVGNDYDEALELFEKKEYKKHKPVPNSPISQRLRLQELQSETRCNGDRRIDTNFLLFPKSWIRADNDILYLSNTELERQYRKKFFSYKSSRILENAALINWLSIEPDADKLAKMTTDKLYVLETQGDGNCLIHALLGSMWGTQAGVVDIRIALFTELKELASNIENHELGWRLSFSNLFSAYNTGKIVENPVSSITDLFKNEISTEMSPYAEKVLGMHAYLGLDHLFYLAHVLHRPILFYTADKVKQPNDCMGSGIFLPLMREPSECVRNPVLISYRQAHFEAITFRLQADEDPERPDPRYIPLHFSDHYLETKADQYRYQGRSMPVYHAFNPGRFMRRKDLNDRDARRKARDMFERLMRDQLEGHDYLQLCHRYMDIAVVEHQDVCNETIKEVPCAVVTPYLPQDYNELYDTLIKDLKHRCNLGL